MTHMRYWAMTFAVIGRARALERRVRHELEVAQTTVDELAAVGR